MEFRTPISFDTSWQKISLNKPIFTLGSCFSDVIGEKLQQHKFQVLTNPFGVVFNPISLHKLIRQSIDNQMFNQELLIENQQRFFHYDFHSEVNAGVGEELIRKIQNLLKQSHNFLQQTQYLIITYGTAFVYQLLDNQLIVNNCHKQSAKLFQKRLLSTEEIVIDFAQMYEIIKVNFPQINILLTVSPVRHIKDTLPLNSVSKAILRYACHQIITQFPEIYYFPSYEIMMDDLRDYRFYKADMIHPNEMAEEYIWRQFTQQLLDDNTQKFIQNWQKIRQALNHRPFHPQSIAHQKFLQNTLNELERLAQQVDVKQEINFIHNQIINQ
jgi:hypothetical protein